MDSKSHPEINTVARQSSRPDFQALKVPAELHLCVRTGHIFGKRANYPKPAGKWIERFEEWLADGGFLKEQ